MDGLNFLDNIFVRKGIFFLDRIFIAMFLFVRNHLRLRIVMLLRASVAPSIALRERVLLAESAMLHYRVSSVAQNGQNKTLQHACKGRDEVWSIQLLESVISQLDATTSYALSL